MKKKYGFMLAVAVLLAGCGQKKETSVITARRVKIDHQKRFFGYCRSRGVCEAGIPGQRTNHQPACHRRRESKEGTIDCSYRPQGHRPAICRYQIGV